MSHQSLFPGKSYLLDYTPPDYRVVTARGLMADGKPYYRLTQIIKDVSPLQGSDTPRFDDQTQNFPVTDDSEQKFK